MNLKKFVGKLLIIIPLSIVIVGGPASIIAETGFVLFVLILSILLAFIGSIALGPHLIE